MAQRTASICLKFSSVAALLLIVQSAFAQPKKKPVAPSPFPGLEGAAETRKKELGNDFTLVVADKDSVVWQKAVGDVNLRTQAPIGAISQWLTTALVLQLADEGKLSLDDKIAQYIPVYGSYFKNYISIRHCLTGLMGIKAEPFLPTAGNAAAQGKSRAQSLEEEVAAYAKRDIQVNAGEGYLYTGMGFNIAARIAEIVTKKKFEQLMRQRILTPLGMRNTAFATDDGSMALPSFGAKSTGADLIRFLQMLLNNGSFGGKQILSEAAMAELRKTQVDAAKMKAMPKPFAAFEQGLGVWTADGGNLLVSPGLTGVWASVDLSRGQALVVLPKSFSGEQNSVVYMGLKTVLDAEWKGGRK